MGLTARQVRIRGVLIAIAFVLTLVVIVSAFAFAGTADWLVSLILLVDIPVYVLIAIVEWVLRKRA